MSRRQLPTKTKAEPKAEGLEDLLGELLHVGQLRARSMAEEVATSAVEEVLSRGKKAAAKEIKRLISWGDKLK